MSDSAHAVDSGPTVLQAVSVRRRFGLGAQMVNVLEDVNLEVQRGQTVALLGASGSGKSTLLHLLGGLDSPDAGRIELMGRDWVSMGVAEQGRWRNRHLGFVYQFHHLLPEFNALDNVAMPLRIRGQSVGEARSEAASVLESVGLQARVSHRPGELSGGERQRVALGRALVTRPACLLADEPTGNLDRRTAQTVFDLLMQAAAQRGTALVLVTHDESLAARCTRRLRMEGGTLVEAP